MVGSCTDTCDIYCRHVYSSQAQSRRGIDQSQPEQQTATRKHSVGISENCFIKDLGPVAGIRRFLKDSEATQAPRILQDPATYILAPALSGCATIRLYSLGSWYFYMTRKMRGGGYIVLLLRCCSFLRKIMFYPLHQRNLFIACVNTCAILNDLIV